jgi:hypothetical protein
LKGGQRVLTILVPGISLWDNVKEEFTNSEETVLELEHSLASLSKWEAIHEKPFLGPDPMTNEEVLSYVQCMILDPNFPPEVLSRLSQGNINSIQAYIDAKMTATWFNEPPVTKKNTEIITAELIYYWMISLSIPIEFENWHLNRLFTLIKIFNVKNTTTNKKLSPAQLAARNRELNEKRKAALGTTG